MSHILAFDTAGPWCAACLLTDGQEATRVDTMARGQAEHLMPLLEVHLQAQGLAWTDLDAIGVGTGPGNFTGIRIAVSAARGLALGLGIPAVGVTHLEAAAFDQPDPVTVRLPAPRGQVYLQRFGAEPSVPLILAADDPQALPAPAAPDPEVLLTQIARITAKRWHQPHPRPSPCYVRAADAAPPKDPAPAILA